MTSGAVAVALAATAACWIVSAVATIAAWRLAARAATPPARPQPSPSPVIPSPASSAPPSSPSSLRSPSPMSTPSSPASAPATSATTPPPSPPSSPLASSPPAAASPSSSHADVVATASLLAGLWILAATIATLWMTLGRPPLRTLGETRLWYAFWLPTIGLLVERRLGTAALRLPMLAMGLLFVGINLARPDALDRTLMPALRSAWFVPHVTVYLVAYAALGLSCGAAIAALVRARRERREPAAADVWLPAMLARVGVPFLTFGLLFGALWAKGAWGHYWSWDPKETWAFITWAVYLGLLHAQQERPAAPRTTLRLYAGAFAVVLGCWFLVNYLPAAQASVHTYAM